MSMGTFVPSSAAWDSAECRSWWSVAPPDACLNSHFGPFVGQAGAAVLVQVGLG